MATMQSLKAPDDPAHGNVVEPHFDSGESHEFQVRCVGADVGFPISSAGKASQQGDWFEFDASYQVTLSGPDVQTTRTCAGTQMWQSWEKTRRACWLPGSATDRTDGVPLYTQF